MSFYNSKEIQMICSLAKGRKVDIYLVGGFVRDQLLDRQGNNDFDFAISKNALEFAKIFADEIKGAYVLLDEDHGCARVVKKKQKSIFTYDFADYRAETFDEDLKHRDYTINGLAIDIKNFDADADFKKQVIDPKRGIKDLNEKRIKRVSIRSLREDPLRMMRAFSLQASLDFRIELKTLNQIRLEKDLIENVSQERIREELFKIFESNNAYQVIKSMDRVGLLTKVIPQIAVMEKCSQGGYHHLDVWPHSMEALRQLEKLFQELSDNSEVTEYLSEELAGGHTRKALIKFGVLLHDIGKPDTRKREDGKYSFHAHESVGKKIVTAIARMLKISTKERYLLEGYVYWHLRPGYLSNFKNPSQKALYRYFRDTADEAVSVALLSIADQRATRGPMTTQEDQKHHYKICMSLVEDYFKKKKEKPFVCVLDGKDLIKHLKIKPSPVFKKILEEVAEQQVLGKIKTKTQALAVAQTIHEKE